MINDVKVFDITGISFEDFVTFIFDRNYVPSPKNDDDPKPWYWRTEITYDPMQIVSHYIRLFLNPRFLRDRFSENQLDQAFWAIHSGSMECSVLNLIYEESLPFEIREKCVRSMEFLFANLFLDCPLDQAVAMWWDSLAYDWTTGNRKRENGGEDAQMQDVMFETLVKILEQPSLISQGAALHGLGHLHHPQTEGVISQYIEHNPSLDDESHKYALRVVRFEVM